MKAIAMSLAAVLLVTGGCSKTPESVRAPPKATVKVDQKQLDDEFQAKLNETREDLEASASAAAAELRRIRESESD